MKNEFYEVIITTAFRTFVEHHCHRPTAIARRDRWLRDGYQAKIIVKTFEKRVDK
jgi:hypothetical protein